MDDVFTFTGLLDESVAFGVRGSGSLGSTGGKKSR